MQPANANSKSAIRKAILLVGGVLAALAVLIAWRVCFPAFVMPSASMERTVLVGDRLFVDRISTILGRAPRRGDVIVFRYPLNREEVYLKRIAGLPGDRLRIRDKHLYRNGVEVQEPYVQYITTFVDPYRDNFPSTPNMGLPQQAQEMLDNHVVNGELVVPAGKYFVLGDNRDDSADSRYWGFIQRIDVIGRPILIYGSNDPSRVWKPVN
jgi:signal peptidase I